MNQETKSLHAKHITFPLIKDEQERVNPGTVRWALTEKGLVLQQFNCWKGFPEYQVPDGWSDVGYVEIPILDEPSRCPPEPPMPIKPTKTESSELKRDKPCYCLGRKTIENVADHGEFQTEHVDFVAADDLFHKNPYMEIQSPLIQRELELKKAIEENNNLREQVRRLSERINHWRHRFQKAAEALHDPKPYSSPLNDPNIQPIRADHCDQCGHVFEEGELRTADYRTPPGKILCDHCLKSEEHTD